MNLEKINYSGFGVYYSFHTITLHIINAEI